MEIKSKTTGKSYNWTKPTPPTQEDYAALERYEASINEDKGDSLSERELPEPSQEIIAGTEREQAAIRARNLQKRLGLVEPVAPSESVSMRDRAVSGAAPTEGEKKAYYESKYGPGSYLLIGEGSDNALVRIPDGNGGQKWVVDNPAGFDAGDVASASTNVPELVIGALSAMAATPTVQGAFSKALVASGAATVGANIVGSVQDVMYRYATDTPINPMEIATRRGLSAPIEFVAGLLFPYGGDKYLGNRVKTKATKKILESYIDEGDAARSALRKRGVSSKTSADLADKVRAEIPETSSAAQAGDEIANILTKEDSALRAQATTAARNAGVNLDDRAMTEIVESTSKTSLTATEAGEAAIGGAKIQLKRDKDAANKLYDIALAKVDEGAVAAGRGKEIITLDNTAKFINKTLKNTLKTDKGETAKFYTPLLSTIRSIQETTGTAQRLEAVRAVRSALLEIGRGGDNVAFPGMVPSQARRLAAAISEDITAGINRVSGEGGKLLRAADNHYRNLVQPIEENRFISKVVSGKFDDPADVIDALVKGGSKDWAALKSALPEETFSSVRRAVVNRLKDGDIVEVGGKEFVNWGSLSSKLSKMEPEVKNEIFGNSASWQFLQNAGKEFDFIKANDGVFSSRALPSLGEINRAADIAIDKGFAAANKYIKEAIGVTAKRREQLASSLESQIRSGNVSRVVEDPKGFFDAVILSGERSPKYIHDLMNRLPRETREDVANAAYHSYFERARDVTAATVSKNRNRYSAEAMQRNIFGTASKKATAKIILGPERYELIENWTKYQLMLDVKGGGKGAQLKRFSGLVATLPYPNLFAARATAFALEKASGRSFISRATPGRVELFNEARLLSRSPNKTSSAIALIQRAVSTDGFSEYNDMMSDLTPDQQEAVALYLEGGAR